MRLANIGVSPNREKSQPNGTRLELKVVWLATKSRKEIWK